MTLFKYHDRSDPCLLRKNARMLILRELIKALFNFEHFSHRNISAESNDILGGE
jgi:hypothetical protein